MKTREQLEAENIALRRLARTAINQTNRNLDTQPSPQKYAAPYGALAKLAQWLVDNPQ